MSSVDPSGALLALDELAKWRERKRRVEDRLRTVRAQKEALLRELEAVRARIVKPDGLRAVRQGEPVVRPPLQPTQVGVLR